MEKLESILHAEDEARATISEAHEAARVIVADAKALATERKATIDAEARQRAVAASEATLSQARKEAAQVAAGASAVLESEIARATQRLDGAVATVMSELVG